MLCYAVRRFAMSCDVMRCDSFYNPWLFCLDCCFLLCGFFFFFFFLLLLLLLVNEYGWKGMIGINGYAIL